MPYSIKSMRMRLNIFKRQSTRHESKFKDLPIKMIARTQSFRIRAYISTLRMAKGCFNALKLACGLHGVIFLTKSDKIMQLHVQKYMGFCG